MQNIMGSKQNQLYPWYVITTTYGNKQQFKREYMRQNFSKSLNNDKNVCNSQWIKYFIRVVFISICCIGCGYHVYSIVSLFLERPTTVVIETETNSKFELPAISVCVHTIPTLQRNSITENIPAIRDFLDRFKTQEQHENYMRRELSRRIKDKFKGENLTELPQESANRRPFGMFPHKIQFTDEDRDKIINDLIQLRIPINEISSLGPNETLIKSCFVSIKNGENCFTLSEVVTTISSKYKCFTIFHMDFDNRWNSDKFRINRHHDEDANAIEITLAYYGEGIVEEENQSHMFLMVHPPHEDPSTRNAAVLKVEQGMKIDCKLTKVSIKELPKPYASQCINYTQIGYQSRKDCFKRCQIKRMSQNAKYNDTIDYQILVRNDSQYKWIKEWNETLKYWNREECRELCASHDCINEYYHLEKTSDLYLSECASDSKENLFAKYNPFSMSKLHHNSTPPCAKINVKLSTFPMLVYKHIPKIETVEFFCYVGSITGLWLGISALSFQHWIYKLATIKVKQ